MHKTWRIQRGQSKARGVYKVHHSVPAKTVHSLSSTSTPFDDRRISISLDHTDHDPGSQTVCNCPQSSDRTSQSNCPNTHLSHHHYSSLNLYNNFSLLEDFIFGFIMFLLPSFSLWLSLFEVPKYLKAMFLLPSSPYGNHWPTQKTTILLLSSKLLDWPTQ